MADTFLDLQNQLALMVGADAVAQLPSLEQEQIKRCINESYTRCYLPIDGRRPPWASRYFTHRLHAATPFEVTVTQDSPVIECADYATVDPTLEFTGSLVKIGTDYYTRASISGNDVTLLESVPLTSGTYTATFYFNSVKIDAQSIDVIEKPELAGEGLLSPMEGKSNELTYRSLVVGDFTANPGQGYQHNVNFRSPTLSFDVGRPLFYFVDPTAFTETFQHLFAVYPLPDQAENVRYRANVLPTELSGDADIPVMPPNTINAILLPMAIYTYCSRTRRYNGDNRTFLRDRSIEAERQLRSMRTGQKDLGNRWGVKAGYA